ncbi:MAG: DEAD/DEAH box helicase [Rhodospirillales bacterium]|nr:DEAD/DEAH box helicase [Rhodospirillales bacterium]
MTTTMTTMFAELGLIAPLCRALADEGYTEPTPIQRRAIPTLLQGGDLLGIAQTGTGKTAAFALPALQWLSEAEGRPAPKTASVLVLTPTRELAIQIDESFQTYGRHLKLSCVTIFGGVNQNPQVNRLRQGTDILVATPGRLLDLMAQGHIRPDAVETFVLDEADRMLDMGFIHDVKRIIARLPEDRQTVMFSATMPGEVSKLAASILRKHERVEVTPQATTVERIEQSVLFVDRRDKIELLHDLLTEPDVNRAIVFARTRHGANRIVRILDKFGVSADAIHGNKSQSARQRALKDFRDGKVNALVATDIAARGIDIDDVSHIINFDLPNEPESYVHRIGRTARAGAQGKALSFCSGDELACLRDIERTTRRQIAVDADHRFHAEAIALLHESGNIPKTPKQNRGQRAGGQRSGGQRTDGQCLAGKRSGRKPRSGGGRSHRGRGAQRKAS